jgi:hypothetical protein
MTARANMRFKFQTAQRADARHRPVFIRPQGTPVVCRLSLGPVGAVRNDWRKTLARGARTCMRAPECRFRTGTRAPARRFPKSAYGWCPAFSRIKSRSTERPRIAVFACVPHADGLCGLLHVPRNCRFRRHAAWFVRTAARTCTWTVRPILLRAFALRRTCAPALTALPPRLPDVPSVIRVLQARHRSGHRIQPRIVKTVMTRPSPGLDA